MSEIKLNVPEPEKQCMPKIGVRYYQFVLIFFSLMVSFALRTNIAVAMVSMTSETPPNPDIPTYPEWTNTEMIMSSFFWGYVIPQILAGQLCERFGPKWFLTGTFIIGTIAYIIIPVMASAFGSTGVIICRIIQGLNQGFLYPGVHNLMSKWTPLGERGKISNIVYSGGSFGIALGMPIAGSLCGSQLGWPALFYVLGGVSIVWTVIFTIFIENSPETHKRITEEEKRYIQEGNAVNHKEKVPTPWISIFTSLPMWAILVAAFAQAWGTFTLLSEMPVYLNKIMDFDIKSNSLLSALPYFSNALLGFVVSPLADTLISKNILSITNTRKMSGAIATIVPAIALIWLGFIDKSQSALAVVLLVVSVSFGTFTLSGYVVNTIDIAPNHAGTIMGIVNGCSNIFSFLGPMSVPLFGSDKSDPILWRKVFLIAAGALAAGGTFYAVFTSAEVQPWNNGKDEKSQECTDPES